MLKIVRWQLIYLLLGLTGYLFLQLCLSAEDNLSMNVPISTKTVADLLGDRMDESPHRVV